jgi:hypothetical protein
LIATQDTPVQERTHDLFMRAVLADDDLGYPNEVSFVPGDQDWADAAVWEIIHDERQAAVVVMAAHEILLTPRRRNPLLRWLDGLRGSTPVLAQCRTSEQPCDLHSVATRVTRRSLDRVRATALA